MCVLFIFSLSTPSLTPLSTPFVNTHSLTRRAPTEQRQRIVRITREGCAPLFVAARRGAATVVDYLIGVCQADVEQRGIYEVLEDNSVHHVTPLWCAAVSGQLAVIKTLLRHRSDIDASSDTGSTPVRSACFMTNVDVVNYLVEQGADIRRANYNGGTCLINSVQSVPLCQFLLSKGADVNAKDIQDKTALHYAIQEHRLETTKVLLEHGADPFAQSRYGDDALQTACLKGAHKIFNYLKRSVKYSTRRLADAHELIGCTFLDEHNETRVAILNWRLAHHMRMKKMPYLGELGAICHGTQIWMINMSAPSLPQPKSRPFRCARRTTMRPSLHRWRSWKTSNWTWTRCASRA